MLLASATRAHRAATHQPPLLCTACATARVSYSPAVAAAGGNLVDMSRAMLYVHPGTGAAPWLRPGAARAPLTTALATRHLLEQSARRLVEANARVELRYGCCVAGLLFDDDGGAVTGA